MHANYVYFVSQLPMLHFGAKPAFSLEEFLRQAAEFAPEKDMAVLNSLAQPLDYGDDKKRNLVIGQWVDFDTALRNELAKIRSSRKHVDPSGYLRRDGLWDQSIIHIAQAAQRNPSLLEAERSLDEARWVFLDRLEAGHFFDLEILVIYAYKLSILRRWENIRSVDKEEILEQTLKQELRNT